LPGFKFTSVSIGENSATPATWTLVPPPTPTSASVPRMPPSTNVYDVVAFPYGKLGMRRKPSELLFMSDSITSG
jgi:hypothetical protein